MGIQREQHVDVQQREQEPASSQQLNQTDPQGSEAAPANDNRGTWHSEFSDILTACSDLAGKRGAMAHLLAPTKDGLIILKPRHSAFHSAPLQHLLTKMREGKFIIAGLAADMCVMLTATDTRMLDYQVWLTSDCPAAESAHRKQEALLLMLRLSGKRTLGQFTPFDLLVVMLGIDGQIFEAVRKKHRFPINDIEAALREFQCTLPKMRCVFLEADGKLSVLVNRDHSAVQ